MVLLVVVGLLTGLAVSGLRDDDVSAGVVTGVTVSLPDDASDVLVVECVACVPGAVASSGIMGTGSTVVGGTKVSGEVFASVSVDSGAMASVLRSSFSAEAVSFSTATILLSSSLKVTSSSDVDLFLDNFDWAVRMVHVFKVSVSSSVTEDASL